MPVDPELLHEVSELIARALTEYGAERAPEGHLLHHATANAYMPRQGCIALHLEGQPVLKLKVLVEAMPVYRPAGIVTQGGEP